MYQLYFYVPESYAERVKEACFAAGAGSIGNYSRCAWQTSGTGQFYPEQGSSPFTGRQGTLEKEKELKVEMVLQHEIRQQVIQALRTAHPYEEPAFGLIDIITS